MKNLVTLIGNTPGCEIIAQKGSPPSASEINIPQDVLEFYKICGGARLFLRSDYPITILQSCEIKKSNEVILNEVIENDPSNNWYVIAKCGSGEYISIDFSIKGNGRCFDSFYETYGLIGEMKIVATSFSEFIARSIGTHGGRYYWLEDNFCGYGDAYD